MAPVPTGEIRVCTEPIARVDGECHHAQKRAVPLRRAGQLHRAGGPDAGVNFRRAEARRAGEIIAELAAGADGGPGV